ncbi:MAG TPA: flagellar basal-body MS-ring/collar protein FliF [Steroidobacteraceae bacterium]|jgi:flagellar M-ring protein FliF|nr:flagellar basal-body MS-ring/collar protein FliF [Steroidobacteraceae bacterium]
MAADSATVSTGLANSPANVSANIAGLPATLRPLLLLIGIAAAVAAGVWIVLWSRGSTYSLLYANMSPQDEAQVAQSLDAAQIPYKLDSASSGIEVPAERLDEARLKLAGQGLTDNDSFAALEKSSGFGVSQFMEDVRYQHALEMELARTIASLQPVAGARVNLAEPRQSVFVSDNHTASASVFVELKSGATLGAEQVQGIVNLVASSVPNLSPGAVTVVDQQGHLLSAPNGHDPYAMDEREYDMVHRMETDYARRIEALLTPLVGPGLVHAQVVADLNLGVSEQSKEQYTPNSQIVRSEQLSEQAGGSAASGGVPGSLSNEPPTPGVAVPQSAQQSSATPGQNGAAASGTASATPASGAPAANAAPNGGAQPNGAGTPAATSGQPGLEAVGGSFGGPGDKTISRDVTRNYEIDRTLAYTSQPAGTVRRLTVAVLIGDRTVTGTDGKSKKVPLSADDLARVTQLVKNAVGFDASRGDNVSVVNESLDSESTPASNDGTFQAPPLWQTPIFWSLVRIGAGLVVVLVLVLSVLRPLVKTLITPMRLAPAGAAPALPAGSGGGGGTAALPGGQREPVQPNLSHEQQLTQARSMVNQDPKRVAQVVRGWVGSDE